MLPFVINLNPVIISFLANPDVDYWEGYNEPSVSTYDQISWMSQMEVARLKILNANGLKGCIGNFAVGTPDVTNATMVKAFYPAIQTALQYDGILGLHECLVINCKYVHLLLLYCTCLL